MSNRPTNIQLLSARWLSLQAAQSSHPALPNVVEPTSSSSSAAPRHFQPGAVKSVLSVNSAYVALVLADTICVLRAESARSPRTSSRGAAPRRPGRRRPRAPRRGAATHSGPRANVRVFSIRRPLARGN